MLTIWTHILAVHVDDRSRGPKINYELGVLRGSGLVQFSSYTDVRVPGRSRRASCMCTNGVKHTGKDCPTGNEGCSSCDVGYVLNGPSCNDIDECAGSTPPCSSEAASCTNTDGSFTCDEGVGTSACNNNGVCEAWAEDCFNCPNDCNNQNSNHCCGRTNKNSNSKPCGHPVCTSGSFQCLNGPATALVVRPFSTLADATKLRVSFDKWALNRPCPDGTTVNDLPYNTGIMLYYSGDFTSPAYTSEIKGVIDGLLSDASAAPWAPCFSLGGVQLLDARLPPEVDSYTPENQSSSNMWNSGPNEQFKALFSLAYSGSLLVDDSNADLIYVMEPDSVPQESGWLTTVLNEAEAQYPFAVLGSSYRGQNWDMFLDQLVSHRCADTCSLHTGSVKIFWWPSSRSCRPCRQPLHQLTILYPMQPVALRYHINGNAVYDPFNTVFRAAYDEMLTDVQSEGVSSYDVRIVEILLEQLALSASEDPSADLEALGYKETTSIANFAGTLRALSAQSSVEAAVVHGARDYSDWAELSPTCTVNCTIDLLISDWGIGDTSSTNPSFPSQEPGDVRGDVATVLQGLEVERAAGRLPYSKVVVMTPSSEIAGSVAGTLGSDVPVVAALRDPSTQPTSAWDLCDALPSISAPWVMHSDAHHTIHSPFRLPVQEVNNSVVPVVPFIYSNSPYCGSGVNGCQAKIESAKAVVTALSIDRRARRFAQLSARGPGLPNEVPGAYDHDIAELNMVYNTEKLRTFCADVAAVEETDLSVPTANKYTAYWMAKLGADFESTHEYYRRDSYGLLPTFRERARVPDPNRRHRRTPTRSTIDQCYRCESGVSSFECPVPREPIWADPESGRQGCCRGANGEGSATAMEVFFSVERLRDCKDLCVTSTRCCVGVEFNKDDGRCELYDAQNRPVQAVRGTRSCGQAQCVVRDDVAQLTTTLKPTSSEPIGYLKPLNSERISSEDRCPVLTIDIRASLDHAANSTCCSTNIPSSELPEMIPDGILALVDDNYNAAIDVSCYTGVHAADSAVLLQSAGFTNVRSAGGFHSDATELRATCSRCGCRSTELELKNIELITAELTTAEPTTAEPTTAEPTTAESTTEDTCVHGVVGCDGICDSGKVDSGCGCGVIYKFVKLGNGCCRSNSTESLPEPLIVFKGSTKRSVCKQKCASDPNCKGFEHTSSLRSSSPRCELYGSEHPPTSVFSGTAHCLRAACFELINC